MRATIGAKIRIGFVIVLGLLAIVAVVSVKKMSDMGHEAVSIEKKWMPGVKTLAAMQSDMYGISQSLFEMILETDDQKMVQSQSDMNDLIADLKTIQKQYQTGFISNDHERELFQQFTDAEERFLTSFPEIIQARKSNDFVTASFLISQSIPPFNQAMSQLEALISLNDSGSNLATGNSIQTFRSGRLFVILFSAITMLVGMALALLIARMISRPLIQVTAMAKRLAHGDLTVHAMKVRSQDEIGEMAASFNDMVAGLRELMVQVGLNSDLVAASSQQLTASADQTSSASERVADRAQTVAANVNLQVQDLEESKLTIDTMLGSIRQIVAKEVQHVTTAVREAKQLSLQGNDTIEASMRQMDIMHASIERLAESVQRLGENSSEVGNIIGVITDIASRTNLLALNASIEAARAGDNGSGFAVVALEVRKLAEQTGMSAKQIAQLVMNNQYETRNAIKSVEISAKEAAEGKHMINEAGRSFMQIQEAVQSIELQTDAVSAAAVQMAAGAGQIANSIEVVVRLAEKSAENTKHVSGAAEEQLASMEEIHASATSLAHMASDLQNVISKFKL